MRMLFMAQESSAAVRDEPNPQYLTEIEAQKPSDFPENRLRAAGKGGTGPPAIFRRFKKAIAVVSLSCCFVSIPAMIHKALPPLWPRTESARSFSVSPATPVSDTSVSEAVTVFKTGQQTKAICSVLQEKPAVPDDLSSGFPERSPQAKAVCSVSQKKSAVTDDLLSGFPENSPQTKAVCSISQKKSAVTDDLLSGFPERRPQTKAVCSVSQKKSAVKDDLLSGFPENSPQTKAACSVSQKKSAALSDPLSESSESGDTRPVPSVSQSKPAVSDPFSVSKRLKKRVGFWIKVFGTYTSDQMVIHDGRYASVIYEVIDTASPEFQEQKEKGDNDPVGTARRKYEQLLASMPWDAPRLMTKEQRRIYSLYRNIPGMSDSAKKDAWNRVRIQIGIADTFRAAIIRAGAYLDAMKQILAEQNLPRDLVYLTLIESKFNPYALSYMGAAGVWQFMPRTGKHYNLTINGLIDERRDPVLSTRAAAQLLDHNYTLLKSWPLAVTAYNHGVKGVRNAVANVKSEDIAEIVEGYDGPRFEFASRNFYAEFLAAREIATRYKEYFKDIEVSRPQTVAVMKLSDHITAQTLEKYFEIPTSLIRELNPALDESVFSGKNFIPKEYPLNVPAHQKEHFEQVYNTIPAELKYDYVLPQIKYRVRRGQTLSTIARAHNCSVKEFMRLNGISNPRRIRPGQWLNIPGQYLSLRNDGDRPEPDKSEPDKSESASAESRTEYRLGDDRETIDEPETGTSHRVRRGQTLGKIARLYNTSPRAIIKLNSIRNPQHIRAGQMLRIPEG